jgi:NADPH-dependent 2,4-dienoyl-CoA reductase/sulfur reductase-like enzyme
MIWAVSGPRLPRAMRWCNGAYAAAGAARHRSPMSLPARVDVLVIGAGPTGLMFAVQLARRSLRVLIVDRNPGPSVATKALGVQARTVEIY